MTTSNGQREIALMLDWENIRFGLQQRNLVPNISAIKDEAQSLGRVVVARAYADFQNYTMSNDPRRLYAAGIEPVYVPGRNYDDGRGYAQSNVRKNSVDIKLTADCVEFCHRYPDIDAYMLVSGDGDFIHLVNTLRPYGKFVAIVALSWSASPRLTESADWVRFYDIDVEPSLQETPDDAPAARARTSEELEDEMGDVFGAIEAIVTSQNRPLVLAALKPVLAQRLGGFDERKYGYAKFKPLVMDAQDAGYVRVVTEGLVDWVMPVHSDFANVDAPDDDGGEDERQPYSPPRYDDEDDYAQPRYDDDEDDEESYAQPRYAPEGGDSYAQPRRDDEVGDSYTQPQPRYGGGGGYYPPSQYGGYGGGRGGGYYSPQYGGDRDMTLETLPDSVRREIIRFCDGLEKRSRYLTFTYLLQNLGQQPWMQLDRELLRSSLNSAIQIGLFKPDTYDDFDEFTGLFRHLPTLKLNREHALVEDALGASV